MSQDLLEPILQISANSPQGQEAFQIRRSDMVLAENRSARQWWLGINDEIELQCGDMDIE